MARILIADDDEITASLVSGVLMDAGYACGWVTSAEECSTVMRFKRPDLLLLDQTFPGVGHHVPAPVAPLAALLRSACHHVDGA